MASVLIVDDEVAIVETLGEILAWAGYDVIAAGNGQEGLNELSKEPSLAIIDYMMPVMDGLQMLRVMRSHPAHQRLPVILMSAAGLATVVSAARVADGKLPWDAFVAKPFTPDAVLGVIKRLLRKPR